MTHKKRILYILIEYPQLSQTYIANEIAALQQDYDIEVVATKQPPTPYKATVPYIISDELNIVVEKIKDFKPDILHGHWLHTVPLLDILARKTGVPYTVRAHSFDTLLEGPAPSLVTQFKNYLRATYRYSSVWAPDMVRFTAPYLKRDQCLGVLCFPFSRQRFEAQWVQPDKIHTVYPVVNFNRFYDTRPNGDGIMNVGACLPKKCVEDYIKLAGLVSTRSFRLYPIGYETEKIRHLNENMGAPVEFMPMREPDQMPQEYKRHQWLVYTGALDKKSDLGWSMAVAEAQASGCGVCYPNIREDIADYVGDAGYIYNSIEELQDIIKQPVPKQMRDRGFAQAKKSDIAVHKKILTDIWHHDLGNVL